MTPRKRALTPKQDIAKSRRHAKAARTPAARKVTQEVVEAKERAYGVPGAKQPPARTRQLTQLPAGAGGAQPGTGTKRTGANMTRKARRA